MRTHAVRFTTTHGVCGIQMCFPLAGRDSNYLPCGGAMHRPPMRFLASGQLGTDKQRASFFGRFPPKTVSVIGKCLFCFSDDDTAYTHDFASHPFASFLVFMLSQPKKHVFLFFCGTATIFCGGPICSTAVYSIQRK